MTTTPELETYTCRCTGQEPRPPYGQAEGLSIWLEVLQTEHDLADAHWYLDHCRTVHDGDEDLENDAEARLDDARRLNFQAVIIEDADEATHGGYAFIDAYDIGEPDGLQMLAALKVLVAKLEGNYPAVQS